MHACNCIAGTAYLEEIIFCCMLMCFSLIHVIDDYKAKFPIKQTAPEAAMYSNFTKCGVPLFV